MRLPDLNLFLYAVDETSPHHDRARDWVEEALSGPNTVGLAWIVLLGFVRVSTRSAVFEEPLGVGEALDLVEGWLAQPSTTVVHPTDRHAVVLRSLLASLGTAGNLTTDAHLAALSIEHGAEVCSSDTDFSRFPGVHWTNPLRP